MPQGVLDGLQPRAVRRAVLPCGQVQGGVRPRRPRPGVPPPGALSTCGTCLGNLFSSVCGVDGSGCARGVHRGASCATSKRAACRGWHWALHEHTPPAARQARPRASFARKLSWPHLHRACSAIPARRAPAAPRRAGPSRAARRAHLAPQRGDASLRSLHVALQRLLLPPLARRA